MSTHPHSPKIYLHQASLTYKECPSTPINPKYTFIHPIKNQVFGRKSNQNFHTHAQTYTQRQTRTHTQTGTHLKTHCNFSSFEIYITDMQQGHITDITVNAKGIILRTQYLLDSGNCTNLSKNVTRQRSKKLKFETKKRFSFSSVYTSDLSYVFMDEMNLLYQTCVPKVQLHLISFNEKCYITKANTTLIDVNETLKVIFCNYIFILCFCYGILTPLQENSYSSRIHKCLNKCALEL